MNSGIHLHIGLHKTGTTTLQRFFAHNERVFNDHGFHFPKACRENKPDQIIHSNLSWELLNHGMFDPGLGTFDDLRAEIAQGPPRRQWIISGEGLSRLPKPARLLKAFEDHPLTVIVYVRDPVEAAPSLYSEQLKAGCVDTFTPWIARRAARWLDHEQVLSPWRRAVESCSAGEPARRQGSWLSRLVRRRPPLRLIERSLEPGQLHKASLVDDFLAILAPDGELPGLSDPPVPHHNPRISTLECIALLFINGIQQHAAPSSDKEAIRQRNEARQIVRTGFPDCTKPFESTARQRFLLSRLFTEHSRGNPSIPDPGPAGTEIPPLLLELLAALDPLVPAGLSSTALLEVRQRVARFLMEQGGVHSLRAPTE